MTIIALILVMVVSLMIMSEVVDGYFVPALERIAARLKLSSDAAGATLMAMGSSAPELFVAVIAIVKPGDHGAIGAGTIVGSALFNILVIIGVSAMVQRAVVSWQAVVRDAIFYIAAISLMLISFRDGVVTLGEAVLYVVVYIIYVIAVVYWKRLLPHSEPPAGAVQDPKPKSEMIEKIKKPVEVATEKVFLDEKNYVLNFTFAIVFIALLSWMLVESSIALAHALHISEVIIALTVIAIGTSVPDLLSSMAASRRGRGGMAISNAIGSNIFDILCGLGLPWVLFLLFGSSQAVAVEQENLLSSIMLLFATVIVLLFLLMIRRWNIGKKTGFLLVLLYVAYLVWAITHV